MPQWDSFIHRLCNSLCRETPAKASTITTRQMACFDLGTFGKYFQINKFVMCIRSVLDLLSNGQVGHEFVGETGLDLWPRCGVRARGAGGKALALSG